MAKQLVNPLERHVEKGVLGLAVLLLLGVAGTPGERAHDPAPDGAA